jgi:hypothetical protein
MKNFRDKLVGWIAGVIVFLAALAQIVGYLETSTKWPKMVVMLSSIASPETFTLIYRLLFLFAAALGLWWMSKRLATIEERLWRLEGAKEPYVLPKPNEVMYPPKDGVLWEWDKGVGAAGPLCPLHRDRLFYKNFLGAIKPEISDDDYLGTHGWFVCSGDTSKEFKFYERSSEKVRALRAEAATRFLQ